MDLQRYATKLLGGALLTAAATGVQSGIGSYEKARMDAYTQAQLYEKVVDSVSDSTNSRRWICEITNVSFAKSLDSLVVTLMVSSPTQGDTIYRPTSLGALHVTAEHDAEKPDFVKFHVPNLDRKATVRFTVTAKTRPQSTFTCDVEGANSHQFKGDEIPWGWSLLARMPGEFSFVGWLATALVFAIMLSAAASDSKRKRTARPLSVGRHQS